MAKGKQPKDKSPMTEVANDPDCMEGRSKAIGGSQSDRWNEALLDQAGGTLWLKYLDSATVDRRVDALIQGMIGIGPQDELEGMMAAQLIGAHNAAMECFRRAMLSEQSFDSRRENLNQANKLSRTFATLVEALNRHRGKGTQKVVVEHVHVHSGGQAVVGVVENQGGGSSSKPEEQAHAKPITHAPESTLRSSNKARDRVPVSGDAERPVPNARRKVDRGSER
jgi:hypothetical protein